MTRAVLQLVRMRAVDPGEHFKMLGEPGYTSCRPYEPNDRCGGCDECLAMQFGHHNPGDREEDEQPCQDALVF